MAFKKGDKVKVVPEKAGLKSKELIGRILTVQVAGIALQFEEVKGMWRAERFELVEEALQVGSIVTCLDADNTLLNKGAQYVVEKLYPSGAVRVQGNPQIYKASRFAVMAEWEPKVGDKVYVVDKDDRHASVMDKFINDGKVYTVEVVKDFIHLNNSYYYRKSSLRLAVGEAPKPLPPKKEEHELDLREALFERQKASGLGNGLSSFAFEDVNGKRDYAVAAHCHARLMYPFGSYEHNTPIVALAYGLRHDMAQTVPNAAYQAYCDYIINRSPWAVAFITKDLSEAMEKDIFMNVEVNRHVMAGACVALRTGMETAGRASMFKFLLDKGFNPHTCWLLACAFSKKHDGNFIMTSWSGGHDVIDKNRSFDDVMKFFKQGYHNTEGTLKDPYRTHHQRYVIAAAVAKEGSVKSPPIHKWLVDNSTCTKSGEGWNQQVFFTEEALFGVAAKIDNLLKENN